MYKVVQCVVVVSVSPTEKRRQEERTDWTFFTSSGGGFVWCFFLGLMDRKSLKIDHGENV